MNHLKTLKLFVLLIFTVFALFACNTQKQTETVENTNLNSPPEIEVAKKPDGAGIYKANCARCHGENGEGTDKGISFLKGHALDHTEEDFIKQVENGEKDEKMPAFKDKLTDEEIKAVVKYVREEIQKNADKTAGEKHQH